MWLFAATVTEVPPAVGSVSSFACSLVAHHLETLQLLIILDLNGIYFLFFQRVMLHRTQFSLNVRSTQPCMFLIIVYIYGRLSCTYVTQMFQPPALIIMAIAATWMYCSLTDFCTGSADMYIIRSFLNLSSPMLVVDSDPLVHQTSSKRIRIPKSWRYSVS